MLGEYLELLTDYLGVSLEVVLLIIVAGLLAVLIARR